MNTLSTRIVSAAVLLIGTLIIAVVVGGARTQATVSNPTYNLTDTFDRATSLLSSNDQAAQPAVLLDTFDRGPAFLQQSQNQVPLLDTFDRGKGYLEKYAPLQDAPVLEDTFDRAKSFLDGER